MSALRFLSSLFRRGLDVFFFFDGTTVLRSRRKRNNDDVSTGATGAAFPLLTLLHYDAPTREFLLPYLSIDDLKAMELVSHDTRDAIHDKGYWQAALSNYVNSDPIARKIYEKCTANRDGDDDDDGGTCGSIKDEGEENNDETVGTDKREAADAGDGTDAALAAAKAGDGTHDESGVAADTPFHKRLYVRVEGLIRRLNENIRAGVCHKSTTTISFPAEETKPWGIRAITTDASAKFCFVGYSQRVDIFEIIESNDGAKLNPKCHLEWDEPDRLWPGQQTHHDDNYFGEFLACHGDYVIVGHQCGLVTIWNWKNQILVQRIEYHALNKPETDEAEDWLTGLLTGLTGMVCKENTLMLSAAEVFMEGDAFRCVDKPVTIWKLHERKATLEAVKINEIFIPGLGSASRHGIDFDGNLAVIAYQDWWEGGTDVAVWDLDQHGIIAAIVIPVTIRKISIDAKSRRILLATHSSTQMYSLQNVKEVLTYKIDFQMDQHSNPSVCTDVVTSFWTDWKDRLIVSYHHNGIVFYDLSDEKPIARIQRTPSSVARCRLINFLRIKIFVDNICFDGAYMVNTINRRDVDVGVNEHTAELCLYDFLKLKLKS